MNPEDLTIKDIEKYMNLRAREWEGNCFGVATAVAELLPGSFAVYGHYTGYVNPEGFWGRHCQSSFIQHGWTLLEDGSILDPTRWSFENVEPYIFLAKEVEAGHSDYDEGGNFFREMSIGSKPPRTGEIVNWSKYTIDSIDVSWIPIVLECDIEDVHMGDLAWAASLSHETLDIFKVFVYRLVCKMGLGGFIPLDNWRKAVRDGWAKESWKERARKSA